MGRQEAQADIKETQENIMVTAIRTRHFIAREETEDHANTTTSTSWLSGITPDYQVYETWWSGFEPLTYQGLLAV